MFNKFKSAPNNANQEPEEAAEPVAPEEIVLVKEEEPAVTVAPVTTTNVTPNVTPNATQQRGNGMMGMLQANVSKPSILSEGFYFKGELSAKGNIHVEGSLNGQVQVDELTIGSRGQVDGIVNCKIFHIKGRFSGTATCEELTVTSSATVDGHVVYKSLSVQKGASIKGELLLAK
jgi:cytoskeletal protein CcmA (bactofilin family)